MRGEGGWRDHFQPRTWSKKQTLNRCDRKRDIDDVVLIDVDGERLENVIIIDVPETLQHKIGGSSKGKKFQFRGIISVDDDDDEDVGCSEMGNNGGGDLESDSSSSKSCPVHDNTNKSVHLGDDECQVVKEKSYAFRAPKCKQASGRDPFSNRYGFYQSYISESDDSDCEIMEGTFGELQREWAKANLKKKSSVHQGNSHNQACPSSLNNDPKPDVDAEAGQRTQKRATTSFCCTSSNASYEKKNSDPLFPANDSDIETGSCSPGMKKPSVQSGENVRQKRQSSSKEGDIQFRGETLMQDTSSTSPWSQSYKQGSDFGGISYPDVRKSPPRPFFWSNTEEADTHQYHTSEKHDKNTSFQDKESFLCNGHQSTESHDNTEQVVPTVKHREFSQATSTSSPRQSHHTRTVSIGKEKPISGNVHVKSSRQACDNRAECKSPPSECNTRDISQEKFSFKIPSSGLSEVCHEKCGLHVAEKPDSKSVSSCKVQCADQQSKQEIISCSTEVKQQIIGSLSKNQLGAGADPRHIQDVGLTSASAEDIINVREKQKETDEYKRAMEEEMASRQRQLQIQAEEAQRLRKKKRAESTRLLDMERRQKQRLEEIRETQKKDEESMNLKEKFRVEVRKELYKLEITCIDMASLLRALGIHVGGGFHPLSQEVHAAYKRALLRFHPDRASKTDIRQQVEAEEKFKLISRMKEKLLLTTCH